MNEHEEKYQELAEALGWEEVLALVPFPLDRVRDALDAGDKHLNGLQLSRWDRAALGQTTTSDNHTICPCCNQKVPPPKPPRHGCGGKLAELFKRAKRGHSLAEGVCVLKHVAKVEAMKTE